MKYHNTHPSPAPIPVARMLVGERGREELEPLEGRAAHDGCSLQLGFTRHSYVSPCAYETSDVSLTNIVQFSRHISINPTIPYELLSSHHIPVSPPPYPSLTSLPSCPRLSSSLIPIGNTKHFEKAELGFIIHI